ncbi:L-threonylcarbamoyladenylate synthase [Alicyclobacillus fastidiosus]|uniref:Threonylcarbamoyl-AMP synthase n=1 Tax=Alicyclobacillus fastidiosus TaxID=392011 RepID=A0ABY6ZH74_9BACL|nr:L-threonylcarbamoyladenylate synthase [Alicyclobacillus fastidiosus]WAH41857.1 L-threonylcarbamoyladenylate synthase [Alicyclobacillus fastidiosus]GMA63563.1 threonylcarbamoyl-AMP synthase [Alicyclobacillus fastidiosus]
MQRWTLGEDDVRNQESLAQAAEMLRVGKLVAFPTETVYGLGANALDEAAVQRIFAAKGRPADNPLIVHIADQRQLADLLPAGYEPSHVEKKLMDAFWPGPLTLLFPVGQQVAHSVHPGRDTVGIRMPDHPVAQSLIRLCGVPIAAPSANTSGRPSPTTAAAVEEDLADALDGLVDGGHCGIGVESTVLLVDDQRAIILRPGGVTQEMIANVLDLPVVYDANVTDANAPALAPGMKYRHYAPNASVHVWWGDPEDVHRAMLELLIDDEVPSARPLPKASIIAPDDFLSRYEFPIARELQRPLPHETYEDALAKNLYQLLREFDHEGATDILIHGVNPGRGLGTAVMNRLQKAAEGRVFRV